MVLDWIAIVASDFQNTNAFVTVCNQHQLCISYLLLLYFKLHYLISDYQQVRQLMESNPKLKEVISTVKNKKRYLVVHPDGRVEHVDNLEPIAQKHPNHILINADTLRDHVPWIDPVGTTIPNAPPISTPPKPNAAPAVATAVTSTATATTVTSTGPINKPQLKPHIPHDIKTPATSSLTKNLPVGTSINNAPPVSIPAKRSAPAVATAAALTVTATKVTSPGPILKPHLKPHFPHEPTSTASTASTSAATVIKTSANSSPSKTSITPEIKKAAPSKSTSAVVAPVTPVPTITNIPVAVIPHVAASPYKTPDPPISSMIDGTADNLHAVTIAANTPIVHPSPVPASTPISNTHVNSLTNTVSPITTLKSFDTLTAEPSQTSSVVKVPVEPIPNESAMVSQSDSSTSASLPSDVTSKTDSSTSIVNSDCSVDASSNVPTSETVDDSSNIDEPCSINEDYSKEASSYSTEGTSAETLCEDSDDITDYGKGILLLENIYCLG